VEMEDRCCLFVVRGAEGMLMAIMPVGGYLAFE
jgi:hypothetical protein